MLLPLLLAAGWPAAAAYGVGIGARAPHVGASAVRSRSPGVAMQLQTDERPAVSELTERMNGVREQMMADEKTRAMIEAMRGTNLNDDVSAAEGTRLQVVETSGGEDSLPLTYDPDRLAEYFTRRPAAVATRIAQVIKTAGSWACGVVFDKLRGELEAGGDAEAAQVAKLRSVIVSLGPFFIKLGQALSIRPDILSPRAMVELQQLCDKVPSFDDALAMQTIERELGMGVSDVFSNISQSPVAAASLGQVYRATLRSTGDEVAVKVQRPFVLETVSLDLYLSRQLGMVQRYFGLNKKLDVVALIDEFAPRFYSELDYELECKNGDRCRAEMARLPQARPRRASTHRRPTGRPRPVPGPTHTKRRTPMHSPPHSCR